MIRSQNGHRNQEDYDLALVDPRNGSRASPAVLADAVERVESALAKAERSVEHLLPSPLERRLRIELEVYRRAAQSWRTVAPTPEQIRELCDVVGEVFHDAQEELPTVRLVER
jgi:hypothetical protein